MIYLQLFWEFFQTGLFAVGGGMATIPFLYDISDKTGWFTHQDLANMIAVGESTPGPIGVNMATYVGYSSFGIIGGLLGQLPEEQAVVYGVCIHGAVGDLCAAELGEYSMLPGDMIEALPRVIKNMMER